MRVFLIALLAAISYAQTETAVADEPTGEIAVADEPAIEEAVGRRPYTEIAEDKRCRVRKNLMWNTRNSVNRNPELTRAQCEQEARDANADFYGFEFQLSRCYIATTCDMSNARSDRGTKWKIWRRDQSRQTGAAPAEPAGLPYIKRAGSDQKCENTGNNEHTVATKPECETEARNNNAEYYSYSSRQKKCFYSTTCSNIVSGRSASRWKIYQRDPNDQTETEVAVTQEEADEAARRRRERAQARRWTPVSEDEQENAVGTALEVIGTTNNAVTFFAIIGAITVLYHGVKGVHKMVFETSDFQKINDVEC